MNRAESFAKIEKEYQEYDKQRILSGKFLQKTSLGHYGTAAVSSLLESFSKLYLGQFRSFVDLGSGDGRAALIASLFTQATGVEIDESLISVSKEMSIKTGVFATFVQKDFEEINLRGFQALFINPDKSFYALEKKLHAEMDPSARLIVYGNLYRPLHLRLEKEIVVDGVKIGVYDNTD